MHIVQSMAIQSKIEDKYMHINTIVRDCAWFKYLGYRKSNHHTVNQMHYITASATLGLSLLHCAAFVGAMYLSLDIVFSQHELASPLPICTIIFTALYGVTELFSGLGQFGEALCNEKASANGNESNTQSIEGKNGFVTPAVIFTNRIGMVGMIGCAIAGVVEYFNSATRAPCMLQTLSEKIHFSPEIIAVSIAAAVAVLLGLYILSVYGRDKTNKNETTLISILTNRAMTELEGFAAPCLMG